MLQIVNFLVVSVIEAAIAYINELPKKLEKGDAIQLSTTSLPKEVSE